MSQRVVLRYSEGSCRFVEEARSFGIPQDDRHDRITSYQRNPSSFSSTFIDDRYNPASWLGPGDHASQIVPHRALVVPRVQTSENSAALPLEHHIRRMLDSGTEWIVNVFGRCGSGKTTAMQHVADAFRDEPRLILLDRNEGNTPTETPPRSAHGLHIILANRGKVRESRDYGWPDGQTMIA